MSKQATFGQKAQERPTPALRDPNEFVRGTIDDTPKEVPQTDEAKSAQGNGQDKPADEPKVRITVDVPKSVHKQLQALCNDKDTKLGPYIRELIAKELRRRKPTAQTQ